MMGRMNRPHAFRALLAVVLVLAFAGSAVVLLVPAFRSSIESRFISVLEAVRQYQTAGPMIVGAAFIPACLFFLPGSPLTLFGGFAFGGTLRGLVLVTACVSIGSTLGAALAFLVGRTAARAWIEKRVVADPRFRAIEAAVRENGFKIVLLCRLSPVIPFNLLNYAFGMTSVSFRDYVLASWIGMLPGTVLYVYLGSTMGALADVVAGRVERTPAQQIFFYVGLAATLGMTLYVTRIAKRALASALPQNEVGR
jgi:uncharacterized membrane protein YdjX (TVP38/TMEM64 family)